MGSVLIQCSAVARTLRPSWHRALAGVFRVACLGILNGQTWRKGSKSPDIYGLSSSIQRLAVSTSAFVKPWLAFAK